MSHQPDHTRVTRDGDVTRDAALTRDVDATRHDVDATRHDVDATRRDVDATRHVDATREVRTTRVADTRPLARQWDAETEASALLAARDSVRWGPIFAGLVTAVTTFMLLSLLAVAIGVAATDATNAGDEPGAIAAGSAIVSAVIGLVAFFVGGLVAGRAGAIVGRPAGALNGFLVWALGVVLILLLGALGLSSVIGAAGEIFGQTGVPNVDAPAVDPNTAADTLRNSALVAFFTLAVPALAAAIGGAVGAASDVDDRTVA